MSPLLLLVLLAQGTQGIAQVRQLAYARLARAHSIAADQGIVSAVRAQNAAGETLDSVRAKDAAWVADARHPLRLQATQNGCARRLRELVAADELIVEAFVMDRNGALVCATVETSDYWQGDEAKWQRTYEADVASFVDEPAFDESTGVFAVQLNVLVKAGDTRAGALTLTLKLRLDQNDRPSPAGGGR